MIMKKLIALSLTLIMALIVPLSVFAMEAQPYTVYVHCIRCNNGRTTQTLDEVTFKEEVTRCPKFNAAHTHSKIYTSIYYDCPECGHYLGSISSREVCSRA